MDLLAETNMSHTGRWLLVPRKGERFLGARDRKRVRVRRRRRLIFSFLLESTLVTLLIGLFPPLRAMLVGTTVLAVLLVSYVGLLIHIRGMERHQARIERIRRSRRQAEFERVPVEYLRRATAASGNGNGHSTNGNGNGNGHAHRVNGNGDGNRIGEVLEGLAEEDDALLDTGIRIVEDDVHVIIRRSSDLDAESLRSATR
jgi:hypothetical protein